GGVARLREYGDVLPDWDELRQRDSEIDVAAAENGGNVIEASDEFFGHRQNLIMPGLSRDMSDGWETRRRRGPGHDWCIVSLGATARITRVQVDTSFFRGNYPESCMIEAGILDIQKTGSIAWSELLQMSQLRPHTCHTFRHELRSMERVTHIRFNI